MKMGQAYNATLLTLEHRYYGASQPFGNWTTDNLKYLNTTEALADTAEFINWYNTT